MACIALMPVWPTLADDSPTTDVAQTVAVLDLEAGAKTPKQWLVGAPEFIEISLQKAGVATLERRQIRLVLGERGLWQSGLDHLAAVSALDALSKIGRPAACTLPILILAAEQEDPYLRVNAEWAIHKVGVAPSQVVPCLVQLLDHPNPDVRLRSAKAVIASAKLPRKNFSGKKDDELVAAVQKWWQESGSKQTWGFEP